MVVISPHAEPEHIALAYLPDGDPNRPKVRRLPVAPDNRQYTKKGNRWFINRPNSSDQPLGPYIEERLKYVEERARLLDKGICCPLLHDACHCPRCQPTYLTASTNWAVPRPSPSMLAALKR